MSRPSFRGAPQQEDAQCLVRLVGGLGRLGGSVYWWRALAVRRRFLLLLGRGQMGRRCKALTQTGCSHGAMNSMVPADPRQTRRNGPWKPAGAAGETTNWNTTRRGERTLAWRRAIW